MLLHHPKDKSFVTALQDRPSRQGPDLEGQLDSAHSITQNGLAPQSPCKRRPTLSSIRIKSCLGCPRLENSPKTVAKSHFAKRPARPFRIVLPADMHSLVSTQFLFGRLTRPQFQMKTPLVSVSVTDCTHKLNDLKLHLWTCKAPGRNEVGSARLRHVRWHESVKASEIS